MIRPSERAREVAEELVASVCTGPDSHVDYDIEGEKELVGKIATTLDAFAAKAVRKQWKLLREASGLLQLISREALGDPQDEYISIPTQYAAEASRLAPILAAAALRREEDSLANN